MSGWRAGRGVLASIRKSSFFLRGTLIRYRTIPNRTSPYTIFKPSCFGAHGGLPIRKVMSDAGVVDPAAHDAADAGRDDRHPPPSVSGAEDFAPPSGERREEPRTEIASGIDRVSGVEPERCANEHDEQADDDRRQTGGRRRVAVAGDGEEDGDEQRRADDLIDDAAGEDAQERLRIRGPDAGGPLRAEHLPRAAVEDAERFVVRHEHDGRRRERAGDLRE